MSPLLDFFLFFIYVNPVIIIIFLWIKRRL
jgi:hypothetical protein